MQTRGKKPTKRRHPAHHARMRAQKAGLPPGSLIHTGEQRVDKVHITVFDYDANECREVSTGRIEDVLHYGNAATVSWINVDGLHDVSIVEKLGDQFALHPLTQEDIVNTAQRPKLEDLETYREMVFGMLDTYLSSMSHRMNSVMQVLTIIATIFIPLTFIVGIYGMNFENMPELKWKYGYAGVWGIMLLICSTMLLYFMRKKWLCRNRDKEGSQ